MAAVHVEWLSLQLSFVHSSASYYWFRSEIGFSYCQFKPTIWHLCHWVSLRRGTLGKEARSSALVAHGLRRGRGVRILPWGDGFP